ncbi:DISARM system helicase DrmA [Photobacterium sanguinicancri]|uniref:DISARM system helicase DrmA n=1 Tax=Photobacterium sanguinicancri TaxID=875932 RepID=UPI0026E302AA|nr:DISARM system helicase DrmA [Photobacterium sanguinicancri]MDO6497742.1 DISARM system helicase DrmA [Photobacterium sanguinicancri]
MKNSAFIAVRNSNLSNLPYADYCLQLKGKKVLFSNVEDGSWILVVDAANALLGVGRVYRQRSDLDSTTLFFDKYLEADSPVAVSFPRSGQISRIEWTKFAEELPKLLGKTLVDIPLIEDDVYVRELLQLAVMDDLLGPANGPYEQILDMSVRDRYLVGRLAPLDAAEKGGEFGIDGSGDEEEEPEDLVVKAQSGKGDSPTSNVKPEPDASEEVDAASNQSLIPSSMGFTFCVSGDEKSIELQASWGRYQRFYEHDMYKTHTDSETGEESQGAKVKVWQRIPCGGVFDLQLETGAIKPISIDKENPAVVVQGTVRKPNENGDRLVTIFLVNTQVEPTREEGNKDTAWVFQPEISATALNVAVNKDVFRKRPVLKPDGEDLERESLEMVYRNQVEFASGHGIAVHADVSPNDVERATKVKTVVMPQYEVLVTEVPGLRKGDRPALKKMMSDGYLNMMKLAEMTREELVIALTQMTSDYTAWIEEQKQRIGKDVTNHDDAAIRAITSCNEINLRLNEGIAVLADPDNDNALQAFRFANLAMAKQRVQSIYAHKRRTDKNITVDELNKEPKNYSWRSFQLAFLLLSIPALAQPDHQDRTETAESFADLLWFPTGGGKTEAYLGVAAFTMSIRRFQGNLGGYDSSRGLAVIMRYTLRLLTLQQFQRATALICAMEVIRRESLKSGDIRLGETPFTIGLWVGNRVAPGTTADSAKAIKDIRDPEKFNAGSSSPAQLTSCPWCGEEIDPGKHIEVNKDRLQTAIYCGDKKARCEFSKGKSARLAHPGIPALVVDEEIYHRPPSMMIATVDKFAMMAWRGEIRNLFGKATLECERHGLIWPDSNSCNGNHPKSRVGPTTKAKVISEIRPPDLIIQDEFHLISGPLGTMVGLYETAVDELCSWSINGKSIRPKIIASTATVRKAKQQVSGVFNRQVAVFPPHGLDIEDNFFSVQRPIKEHYGRRYMGVCSPGSARPAVLIRVYTAFLTASQALFDRFGQVADPYMTSVGYFNSLRELGGMKRLAEDDVQTRSYRVQMSLVERPGLEQRSVNNIRELTSRVSSQDIPKYLDQLEVKFKAEYDTTEGKFVTKWDEGESRAIDVVLATNMLSVGVDVNRLGVMAVNGQPKSTAEYIQATSRVGRSFPGLVCTVLTWSRPRDLSHYETFEHYHATFYKHVEAQSVTPFSPRAMDRGLTGSMLSLMRLSDDELNPNDGAANLKQTSSSIVKSTINTISERVHLVEENTQSQKLAEASIKQRVDDWVKETNTAGRTVAYEKKGENVDSKVPLIKKPGLSEWDRFTVPMSMREVEPGVKLQMNTQKLDDGPSWKPPVKKKSATEGNS